MVAPSHLLVGLDRDQLRAVTHPAPLLCILAGAGSGKTRVLTRRIAHRAEAGHVDVRHVLALTFTRRAADELAQRLGGLGLRDRPHVGTFHSVAWGQLRQWHRDRGRRPPELLTSKGRLLASLPDRGTVAVAELAGEIEWARAREVAPDDYPAAAHREDRRVAAPFATIARLHRAYEEEKRRRGVVDFDDILDRCARLLVEDPVFADAQRWRFRHLFVDEYQDVNPLQQRLLEAWRAERDDLCVVGDPHQAIYRWNGADARYLTGFAADHPGAEVVELTRSHRSTPQIVHLAGAALGDRARTRMIATRPAGALPTITAHPTDVDEASAVAGTLRAGHAPGQRWDSQAVLVRTNAQMVLFEEALTRARVPFRLRGEEPLVRRPVVRAALRDLGPDPAGPLAVLVADLQQRVDVAPEGSDDSAHLAALLRLTRRLHAAEPDARVGDLRSWLASATGLDGPGPDGDAVEIVTFHAAKGLEWPVVHVAGLEDGLVPISHARTPEALAEEQRLLYVALSRAEDEVHLSWAAERRLRGRPATRRPSPHLAGLSRALDDLRRADRPVAPDAGLARSRQALLAAAGRRSEDTLLRALRDWRAEVARRADVPPAVVASDRVLSDVAHARPGDVDALAEVRGVGPMVIDAHGPDLLRIVAAHEATSAGS